MKKNREREKRKFYFWQTSNRIYSQKFFRVETNTENECLTRGLLNSPKLDFTALHGTYHKPEQRHRTMCSSETCHLLCAVQGCKSKASKGKDGIL